MDKPALRAADRAPSARFVPDRRYTVLAVGGVVAALVAALVTTDRGGALLALIAALMLACYVVADVVFSPRLEATASGVVIRSPFTRAVLRWEEIDSVRVVNRQRAGLRNSALEIDAGPVIAEFSKRSSAQHRMMH